MKLPRINMLFGPPKVDSNQIVDKVYKKTPKKINGKTKQKTQKDTTAQITNRKTISKTLSHRKRIDAIYLNLVHKLSLRLIADIIDTNFSSIRQVVKNFKLKGRTNKLCTIKSKEFLLALRL